MGSMTNFWKSVPLALVLTCVAPAATINFTGSISSLTQGFVDDGFATGQTVSGSLALTGAGSDFDPNPSAGFYILSVGELQFSLNGIFQGTYTAPTNTMFSAIQNVSEGTDQLQVVVGLSPDLELNLVFLGSEAFLSSDAFPSSPGQINWAAFTGGSGTLTFMESGMGVAGPGDELSFDITGINDVPEPSTFVLAGCALAFIAWRRRV